MNVDLSFNGVYMENVISRATPAMQVLAVVLSYLTELFGRIGSLFSFATGVTSFD